MKLGFLTFTEAADMDASHVLQHYLVAAADPQDPVARRGDELLRKRHVNEKNEMNDEPVCC